MAKNIKEKKVYKDKFGSEFKVHLQWLLENDIAF